VTQQYIVGEFSSLLARLYPAPDELLRIAVGELRHQVEFSPLSTLPRLAQEALRLTDTICWAALEHGDAEGFRRCAGAAVALRDFGVNAGLLAS
jgi:hypothetical protein